MLLRCEKRHFFLEYSNIQTSVPSLSWQIVVLFHTKLKQDCVLQAEATRTVTIPTVVSERILELLESLDQAEEGQQPGLLSGADAGMVVGGGQALGSTWSNGCGKRRLFSKLSSVVPSLSWQIVVFFIRKPHEKGRAVFRRGHLTQSSAATDRRLVRAAEALRVAAWTSGKSSRNGVATPS